MIRIFVIVAFAFTATACDLLATPGGITKVVMAQGAQGANVEPVNVSDNFAPNQNEIHAIVTLTNAPKDSTVKVVWIAADVGMAMPPDTKIEETEIKIEGSRNVDFVLKQTGRQFAPGLYKAEIYLNGKRDRTLNFVVVGTPLAVATSKPAGNCPPATTQPHRTTGLLAQVIMAEGVSGANEPVNRTGEFLPGETIHAVVAIKDAPANTKIRATFFAVDADGSKLCNAKLGESEQIASGSKNLDFTLMPAKDKSWSLGTYRVDVYVNGVLDHTANYVVVTQKQVH